MTQHVLTTARLRLRDASASDIDAIHQIAEDFDVVRNTATWPWPPDRDFTALRCRPLPAEVGFGGVIEHNGEVIGMASVVGAGELGYLIARKHWGQGYTTEICRALMDAAFAGGRWSTLHACVFMDNPASVRVLEKLGFVEGPACTGKCAARGREFPTRTFSLAAPRA